jgi:hypothetical protein
MHPIHPYNVSLTSSSHSRKECVSLAVTCSIVLEQWCRNFFPGVLGTKKHPYTIESYNRERVNHGSGEAVGGI